MIDLRFSLPEKLRAQVDASLDHWERDGLMARLWRGDPSIWTSNDEGRWLGWLRAADDQLAAIDELEQLGSEIASERFGRALLLGMGGSSLAPEVLSRTFGQQPGRPSLTILDSTDPGQIRAAEGATLERTLIIVASKSGSTLEPNILKQYFFDRVRHIAGEDAGRQFIAITDPGSQLEKEAIRDGFRRVLFGDPAIGGRFSALSRFGLGPAAIAGFDVRALLEGAREMAGRCGPRVPVRENPGAVLGVILGEAARARYDKATLVVAPQIAGLGAWLEQLLAESTGKAGKAIIPIDGEPSGRPDAYGTDRVFIQVRQHGSSDREQEAAVDALDKAGYPIVRIDVADRAHLGAEFFRWEMATAVAGAVLQINPFDQPDVESAKQATRRLAADYESAGRLPEQPAVFQGDGVAVSADDRNVTELRAAAERDQSLASWLRAHFARIRPGDYVALLAYVQMSASHVDALQRMRRRIRDTTKAATSVGFGPRYLHSTGQAYKGGPNTGVFLVITASDPQDLPVPGQRYTFGVIKAAQALGDLEVLAARGRRVLRVHLEGDVETGLATLERAVIEALT